MTRQFKLPDLGEGIHEGEIMKILVSQGDQVDEDQTIVEVETDKAAVEVPSPYAGTVTKIHVSEGDLVEVGEVLFTYDGGEETEATANQEEEEEEEAKPEPESEKKQSEKQKTKEETVEEQSELPVPAAPSTRRLARELEVDLRKVPSSGPSGRVTSEDVRAYAEESTSKEESAQPQKTEPEHPSAKEKVHGGKISPVRPSAIPVPDLPDFSRWGEIKRQPLRSIRRETARNMTLSWSQIPHVRHQDVADITELEEFRQRYKKEIQNEDQNFSITVFIMKAAVSALKEHPRFNASLDAESQEIILKNYYHIGVAVDTEDGLLVPIIRDVERKSILELATELDDLIKRTRQREATLEEMQGGSFTITNPGPLGGTGFSPLIKYPEVAILGLAQARWQPVVHGEGQDAPITSRFILPLVLSFDHRVVDGADAARFVNTIKKIIEDPDRLLMRV